MAVITISRGSLSGGARLAERLGRILGYRVISREVAVEAASRYGVSEELIAHGLREPPGLWSRLTHRASDYVLAAQAALSSMIEDGDVVYHGLAGAFLLADLPEVLKVRLIAPTYQREEAAMRELKVGRERAARHVAEVDLQRERWVRALYGKDWGDPAHYDVVVNVADMSLETAAGVVASLTRRPEYGSGPDALRRVRDFALRSRVQASLRLCSPHADVPVDVGVSDGVVTLSGGRAFEEAREAVVGFVRAIAGAEQADVRTADRVAVGAGRST